MFPDGERFFVRAVKRFAHEAQDAKMREAIKIFIGQEMQHGAAHERFNEIMQKSTINMDWFMWFFTKPTFAFLEPLAEKIGWRSLKAFALSITAAAENMTAGFAEMLFSADTLERIQQEDIRELLSWHAAEEIEHRDLAFDLFNQVDGSYTMRMAGMLTAYAVILGYVVAGTGYMTLNDPKFSWKKLPAEFAEMFQEKHSLGRVFVDGFIAYLKKDFHPSDAPIHPKAEAYLAELGAA
jgi:predicted metal-dependent hydrolase